MNKNNRLIHAYVGLVNVMDSNMGTIMNNNIPNYNISNHSYVKIKTSKHSNYDDIRRLNSKPCRVAGTKMWRDETG